MQDAPCASALRASADVGQPLSPGADVGTASQPVPAQMWAQSVPAQMWARAAPLQSTQTSPAAAPCTRTPPSAPSAPACGAARASAAAEPAASVRIADERHAGRASPTTGNPCGPHMRARAGGRAPARTHALARTRPSLPRRSTLTDDAQSIAGERAAPRIILCRKSFFAKN